MTKTIKRNGVTYNEIDKSEFMNQLKAAGMKVGLWTSRSEQLGYTEAVYSCVDYDLIRHTRDGLVIRCYSNRDS